MPRPASDTALVRLRKAAPGSLRQEDVANLIREAGLEVATVTVGDFERGKYAPRDARFIPLYAKAIRQSRKAVLAAFAATHEARTASPASKPRRKAPTR